MDLSACDPRVVPFGFVVSLFVEGLKRIPVLRRYPKVLAAVISLVVPFLAPLVGFGGVLPIGQILVCALLIFGASVVTHEVVTEPVQRRFFNYAPGSGRDR